MPGTLNSTERSEEIYHTDRSAHRSIHSAEPIRMADPAEQP
jgi:hypothetical protein